MKTTLDEPESKEWWHNVMTRPWTFTINFVSSAGPLEVGQGVEFNKSGQVVVEINGRTELYKDKASAVEVYKEPNYSIDWHQE